MNVIREYKDEIMKNWRDKVMKCIPAAHNQSSLALDDSLPDFLENLADILETDSKDEIRLKEAKEDLIGKVHGQHRANNSYAIDQMIDEYFILKDVVLETLRGHDQLDVDTSETINKSFQKALQVSAAQFSKSLLEAQEDFVTTLAHDLRSPLMVIKMHSEVMEKKNAVSTKSTARIKASVDKVDQMIEQLLDSIRSRQNLNTANFTQEFDLCHLIQEVVSAYDDFHEGRIIVEGCSTFVKWDKNAFERVIDNLLSNALKYGDDECPVTFSLQADDDNVFFSIHNKGNPISIEDQLTLFQKFKRSQENQKDRKGWGIGLSYVKTVIEAHKGIVLVHSDDSGTTFKFELPRNITTSQEESIRAAKSIEPNSHLQQ